MEMRLLKVYLGLGLIILVSLLARATAAELNEMTLVSQNAYLELYLNTATTEIAIKDRRSKQLWFSNPLNREQCQIARGEKKRELSSQLSIQYFLPGDKSRTMDNFNDSIALGQFAIKEIKNGVRIEYLIGKEYQDDAYLPVLISKERFENIILNGLAKESEQRFLLQTYTPIYLEKTGDYDVITANKNDLHNTISSADVFGEYRLYSAQNEKDLSKIKEIEAQIKQLPADSTAEIGRLTSKKERLKVELKEDRSRLFNYLKGLPLSRDDIESDRELTRADFSQLLGQQSYLLFDLPNYKKKKLIDLVKKSGYTIADVNDDRRENNLAPVKKNIEVFKIAVEYYLEDENLIVNIPVKELEYPLNILDQDGNKTTLPLHRISLLPYFGAADQDQQGYIMIPEGSGALINYQPGDLPVQPYSANVYGKDLSIEEIRERINYQPKISLPVFGIKNDDQALFAMLEEGESLAVIKAEKSGRIHSFNTVNPEFIVIPKGETYLANRRSKINVYQSRIYQGDIRVRYSFLSGAQANYVGMAHAYREHLIKQDQLKALKADESTPFYLELVGAITDIKPVLGIPTEVVQPLTTFQQAQEIIEKLANHGVNNLKVIYSGWLARGLNHIFPDRVKIEKGLGSHKELLELRDLLQGKGMELYPQVNFLNIFNDSLLDNVSVANDSARRLDRLITVKNQYNLSTFYRVKGKEAYVLSPDRLTSTVNTFLEDYNKQLAIKGIGLAGIGNQLDSDFQEDTEKLIDRQQARQIQTEQLQRLKESGYAVLVNAGNSYAIPYSSNILNLPADGPKLKIIDRSIPFYQIVIHGYIDYAAQPLNFETDIEHSFLKMLETGSLPYFKWFYHDSARVKNTDYDYLFASNYQPWFELAVELYREYNRIYAQLRNQPILNHQELQENVFQTTYQNGVRIIINYNQQTVKIEEHLLDGLDYLILGSEDNEKR